MMILGYWTPNAVKDFHEAMFMARSLQPPAAQSTFHNVTMPVSAAQPTGGWFEL